MRGDLIFLNSKITNCTRCTLFKNGRALPFIGNDIKGILFGEAPGVDEIERGEPFVGRAGSVLMTAISKFGFTRDNFLILNSCNCRPVLPDGKNGKPTIEQMTACYPINEVFFKYAGVKHIMTLGVYPKWFFTKDMGSITACAGDVVTYIDKQVTFNYHPAYCLYNPNNKGAFTNIVEQFCKTIIEDNVITGN